MFKKIKSGIPIFVFLVAHNWIPGVGGQAQAARVKEIRWGNHTSFSRCVIEFDTAPARVLLEDRISDLHMLYCDLRDTEAYSAARAQPANDPNIRSLQALYLPKEKRLRLAIKVERSARPVLMTLQNPGRVVIDFYWSGAAPVAGSTRSSSGTGSSISGLGARGLPSSGSGSVSGSAPSSGIPGGGVTSSGSPVVASRTGKPIVVIDPGHGGWHKGAVGKVGRSTVYEKEITLEIAQRLKRKLEARGRVEVRLTRTRDVYVGLFERTQIAEQYNGDLFVSIHCNSVDGRAAQRKARGIEFWYWNKNSTTSAAVKYLEKLENDEGHADGIGDAAPATRRLIGSLMADQLESMALRSASVCEMLNGTVRRVDYFREHNRGIKSARFKVLETYQMPSVLVEVGFLSHPTESRYLVSDNFQEMTAQALADGIERVMEKLGRE